MCGQLLKGWMRSMEFCGGICFYLDTPEPEPLNGREFYLRGWFIPKEEPVDGLALVVDGTKVPVFTGFARPDVSEHFGDPTVEHCGFLARFKAPKFFTSVSLVARTAGKDVVIREFDAPKNIETRKPQRGKAAPSPVSSYSEWLATWEPALFWPESEIARRSAVLAYHPQISVIIPSCKANPYFLARSIQSVFDQHYRNWQLCVADNYSRANEVMQYLGATAASDARITPVAPKRTGGRADTIACALEAARGEFVVFLNENDELHPHALLEVARSLNRNSGVDLLYTDEDSIDLYGARSMPAFKPDFDPDMFSSFDYFGQLVAIRRELVTSVGCESSLCDDAQLWDLAMRVIERAGAAKVHHLAKPLYHRRAEKPGKNVASHPVLRPTISASHVDVVAGHITRTAIRATAEAGLLYGSVRLKRERPQDVRAGIFLRAEDGAFQAAAIEPNLDRCQTVFYELADCSVTRLESEPKAMHAAAANGAGPQGRMAASFNGSSGMISRRAAVAVREPVRSITEIGDDVLVFINRPLETVNHHFIEELASQAMREDCGVVTGIALNCEGRIVHTGFVTAPDGALVDPCAGLEFPQPGYMGYVNVVRSVETISEHFFAARREHLAAVGGLAVVSGMYMHRVVAKLVDNARAKGLRVLVTPYAVATFESAEPSTPPEPAEHGTLPATRMNPNFGAFANPEDVFKQRPAEVLF